MVPVGDAKTNADGMFTRPLFNARLMLYDVAAKATKDAHDPAFDHSLGRPTWTADSRRLLFGLGERVYRSMFAYDVASPEVQPADRPPDGRLRVREPRRIEGRLHDGLAVGARPTSTLPARTSRIARKLTTVNPQAADFAIGDTEVIAWKSSDGLEIEGVLVKPVGYQAGRKYPLLVDVHGGPDRRAHQRLQGRRPQRRPALGRAGLGRALPEPARQQQLRREVHAREHPRLGRRRLSRHHGRAPTN